MKKSKIKNNKNKIYISYELRVAIPIIIFLILLVSSFYCINKSITINDEKKITYTEKSNLDYKVRLKDNDFYDTKVLGKNMSYIANLIEIIKVNFNYNFDSSLNIDSTFKYDIVGNLKIKNPNSNEVYLEKEYILKEEQEEQIKNKSSFKINEDISIDYDYYNKLANSFKSTYSVDTESSLVVSLRIKNSANPNKKVRTNDNSNISITIPLSQKAISIKMNYKDINNKDTVLNDKNLAINDTIYLTIGAALFILSLISIFITKQILNKNHTEKNMYDVLINKYLREYDRLIVNVKTKPNFDEYNIVKIGSFNEMLDLHDNYNEPIRYFEVTKHIKSYFYIQREKEIFLYTVKKVDIDEQNEK